MFRAYFICRLAFMSVSMACELCLVFFDFSVAAAAAVVVVAIVFATVVG